MTLPSSNPAAASPVASPPRVGAPPLVVRPDRAKARGWLTFILLTNGSLAALCLVAALWASSSSVGALGGASFAITLSGCVFQMVFHGYFWGRFLGADVVAEAGPYGIRALVPGEGMVSLPWHAVASVSTGWNAVVIRPADGTGPTTNGVEGAVRARTWRRLARRGIQVPKRAITPDIATLRAAIHHFSGGGL